MGAFPDGSARVHQIKTPWKWPLCCSVSSWWISTARSADLVLFPDVPMSAGTVAWCLIECLLTPRCFCSYLLCCLLSSSLRVRPNSSRPSYFAVSFNIMIILLYPRSLSFLFSVGFCSLHVSPYYHNWSDENMHSFSYVKMHFCYSLLRGSF